MPATRWSPRTVVPLLLAVLLLLAAAAPTPPGIPTSIAVTAGDGSAVVQWVAPDDGGATISGYTVSAARRRGHGVLGVARSATVTGLTNGVTYRLTVTASNRLGAGTVVTADFTLTALGSATAPDSQFNDFSIVFGYRGPDSYWFASFSEGNDPNTSGIFRVEGGCAGSWPTSPRRLSWRRSFMDDPANWGNNVTIASRNGSGSAIP